VGGESCVRDSLVRNPNVRISTLLKGGDGDSDRCGIPMAMAIDVGISVVVVVVDGVIGVIARGDPDSIRVVAPVRGV
jgi:hypothetical protein